MDQKVAYELLAAELTAYAEWSFADLAAAGEESYESRVRGEDGRDYVISVRLLRSPDGRGITIHGEIDDVSGVALRRLQRSLEVRAPIKG